MKVLAVNTGSSSLKYKLFDMPGGMVLAWGCCEGIGEAKGESTYARASGEQVCIPSKFGTYEDAFLQMIELLSDAQVGAIEDLKEIDAVGHRVVQGGSMFCEPVLIDDDVVAKIEKLSEIAQLHNRAGAAGIKVCQKLFGAEVFEVAVFDTQFHAAMPRHAYTFGMPYEYYKKLGIRKYGFHGLSHKYVSRHCAQLMKKDLDKLKIISCHLGSGCSVAAIRDGESVDTSMGFTPTDGVLMSTRSGSVDPSAMLYVMKKENLSAQNMEEILNKKSGYLGISGVSSDLRMVQKAADLGDVRAKLAIDMQVYQIKKQIGAYVAVLNGLDALVFTGKIGVKSAMVRQRVCEDMETFNIRINKTQNDEENENDHKISKANSKDVWVITTNEELIIARETQKIAKNSQKRN